MRSIHLFINVLLAAASALFVGCNEILPPLPEDLQPQISTHNSPIVSYNHADVSITITNAANANEIGVCYGTERGNLTSFAEIKVKGDNTYHVKIEGLEQGIQYFYQADAKYRGGETKGSEYEFRTFVKGPVDLGLPSGLKWASCNLDAALPTDVGGYYAWGETETKNYYDWNTYVFCTNGDYQKQMTKYISYKDVYMTTDGRTGLTSDDDAAYARFGGGWRIPTSADITELLQHCNYKEVTVNGIKGYRFVNKNTMDETIFIFIPCFGYKYKGDVYDDYYHAYIWSSILDSSYGSSSAYCGRLHYHDLGTTSRALGLQIRPVCE